LEPVATGENVCKKGEDASKGEVAVKAGTRLKPQHLGLMAALGIKEVKVFDKPKIALLATGNELVEIFCPPLQNFTSENLSSTHLRITPATPIKH